MHIHKTQAGFLIVVELSVFRCLDFLLDNGANPTLKNSKGYSAVHYAAACGNKQHLELVSAIFCFYCFNLFILLLICSIKLSLAYLQLLEISFNCLEEVESNIPVSPLHLAVSSTKTAKHSFVHNIMYKKTHWEILSFKLSL